MVIVRMGVVTVVATVVVLVVVVMVMVAVKSYIEFMVIIKVGVMLTGVIVV